jgi:hypothetical protein
MPDKSQTHSKPKDKPEPVFSLEPDAIEEPGEILERPDGYYWRSPEGPGEYGPFDTVEAAMADRDSMGDDPPDGLDALHEVERDLGMNEWIDAETGEPAEGQSPPHLEE